VCTDWSGTTDFVTPSTGYPVSYRLIPACDPQGTYHHPELSWADPDATAAADRLRELYGNPAELGERVRDYALRRFSAEAYVASVQSFLTSALRVEGRKNEYRRG
jgi:hypothetical protein